MESLLSVWNSASPVVTRASTGLRGCVYSSLQPWSGGRAWLSSAQLLMVTFTIISGCHLVRHQQAQSPQERWRQTISFVCIKVGLIHPLVGLKAKFLLFYALWMHKTVKMSSQQCCHNIIALMAFSTHYLHVHQLLQTSHILNHAVPLTQTERGRDWFIMKVTWRVRALPLIGNLKLPTRKCNEWQVGYSSTQMSLTRGAVSITTRHCIALAGCRDAAGPYQQERETSLEIKQ